MTRQCGECSLCCKLLQVSDGDFQKPKGQWCQHCRKDKGCGIYEERPSACRTFSCQWLIDPDVPNFFWPKTSRIIFSYGIDQKIFFVDVDPDFAQVWQREPYRSHIMAMASHLLRKTPLVPTVVKIGKQSVALLPPMVATALEEEWRTKKTINPK